MNFKSLEQTLKGELFTDEATRRIYATDASAYREIPIAVAIPADTKDIQVLIALAKEKKNEFNPTHSRHFFSRSSGRWWNHRRRFKEI